MLWTVPGVKNEKSPGNGKESPKSSMKKSKKCCKKCNECSNGVFLSGPHECFMESQECHKKSKECYKESSESFEDSLSKGNVNARVSQKSLFRSKLAEGMK